MVIITNEKRAKKIFARYNQVAAFNLGGKSKGFVDDEGKIIVSYEKSGILPDNDTVNAVVAGHMSGKKVIKKAVKNLKNPTKAKNGSVDRLTLAMGALVNMVEENGKLPEKKTKKGMKRWIMTHPPVVLMFVVPEAETPEDKKRNKFLSAYVSALFGVYGLAAITDKKELKTFIKVALKNKKPKKNAVLMKRLVANNKEGCQLSKKGRELFLQTRLFYSVEYINMGLDNPKDPIQIDKDRSRILANHLASMWTTEIINRDLSEATKSTKKFNKVVGPHMSKRIRTQAKWYKELNNVLTELGPEFKLPKVIVGCTKKSVKKANKTGDLDLLVPKMKAKKFVKFFVDKDNRPLLRMVFAHLSARAAGCELGSNDYNRSLLESITTSLPEDFAKAYVAAAKAYAKARAKAREAAVASSAVVK